MGRCASTTRTSVTRSSASGSTSSLVSSRRAHARRDKNLCFATTRRRDLRHARSTTSRTTRSCSLRSSSSLAPSGVCPRRAIFPRTEDAGEEMSARLFSAAGATGAPTQWGATGFSFARQPRQWGSREGGFYAERGSREAVRQPRGGSASARAAAARWARLGPGAHPELCEDLPGPPARLINVRVRGLRT